MNLKRRFKEDLWVYISRKPRLPSKTALIIQSYVDTVVEGCLLLGKRFAKEFVKTTEGWNSYWLDDRKKPRYPRHIKTGKIKEIDSILKEVLGKLQRKPYLKS